MAGHWVSEDTHQLVSINAATGISCLSNEISSISTCRPGPTKQSQSIPLLQCTCSKSALPIPCRCFIPTYPHLSGSKNHHHGGTGELIIAISPGPGKLWHTLAVISVVMCVMPSTPIHTVGLILSSQDGPGCTSCNPKPHRLYAVRMCTPAS